MLPYLVAGLPPKASSMYSSQVATKGARTKRLTVKSGSEVGPSRHLRSRGRVGCPKPKEKCQLGEVPASGKCMTCAYTPLYVVHHGLHLSVVATSSR